MHLTLATLAAAAALVALVALAVAAALRLVAWRAKQRRQLRRAAGAPIVVGVFHPYCNAGGGGERVLWFALQATQGGEPDLVIRVFAARSSGDKDSILRKARERFGVTGLDAERIEFVFLDKERLLEAEAYPRLTLVGQSLGSVLVGAEALGKCCPDVYLDTMGYAFTYPLAWLRGCVVASYTHYPTISTDMLRRVYERRPAYNNDELISGSIISSRLKYVYYQAFRVLYYIVGQFADITMVNSSWTKGHIDSLWGTRAAVVFPPCDTGELIRSRRRAKRRVIVSLGQFRPEKDHRLQILALSALQTSLGERGAVPKLVLFGSCRDAADEARIDELRRFAEKCGVAASVDFRVNVPFAELKEALSEALMGVHTMWNEHFGIAPVEMMAAGVILVAHNSGGPRLDIVEHGVTGFLASSADEYAEVFARVLDLYDNHGGDDCEDLHEMRAAAERSVARFSQENFVLAFVKAMHPATKL
ncbi:2-mannosyltransferase (Asparagine-linked glycosylation protein 11 homolog) (Glycolipid 2-alpha-mannosyltransferase) [Durusdinium trenchii]|uniref:GDP-Man:Man(3)GlcNAc(2)-PP-Dol alpha-1,2-mannosyltransferase n=1 Tax=Durusdinium trenchii TaxID=1381693 RepID=A0ABP0IUQ3_9DINO